MTDQPTGDGLVKRGRGRPKGVKNGQGEKYRMHRIAPYIRMPDEYRAKIKTVAILNALQEHVFGMREMHTTQVQAGLGLLKKTLPDLAQQEHSGSLQRQLVIVSGVIRSIPELHIPQPHNNLLEAQHTRGSASELDNSEELPELAAPVGDADAA